MAATASPLAGVGLGYRRELAASLLTAPASVGFVEIIAESCFNAGATRREVQGLAEIWPVLPHGIQLSLGSADGIDEDRARRLGELARSLRAPLISEHVAFTRGRGREIGHLTQLPLCRTAVAVVARNVARTRRQLPDVPFLLENPAWTLRWSDDEMDEGSFFHEIVAATGCELLLDIANIYANATNSGQDPLALLRSYPLSRVAMVHMAGGAWRDDFYVDTHCHPTPGAVLQLLTELVRVRGPLPVVLERDGRYPPFAELSAELDAARHILGQARQTPCDLAAVAPMASAVRASFPSLHTVPTSAAAARSAGAMVARQARLAQLLTSAPASVNSAADTAERRQNVAASWSEQDIARSRSVLVHKRAEEALECIARIRNQAQKQHVDLYELALNALRDQPRAASLPAVVDAMHIASQLLSHPRLGQAARFDLLTLRARFAVDEQGARLRFAPFLARSTTADGSQTWVAKAPGRRSRVRFFFRKPTIPAPSRVVTTRSP